MNHLILTVLLAVMQAHPQVPGTGPDSAASTSQSVQNKTSSNQAPPTPSQSQVNATRTASHDGTRIEQGTDNSQNPIIVGKLPSVTVETHRDWIDRGIWIFNGLLVFVGLLQWLVLRRQACLMGTHARHLENLAIAAGDNAKAAQLNAQAIANAERPWLIIEIGQDDSGMGTHLLRVWNRGKTPAEMIEGRFGYSVEAPTGFVPTESMMGPFVAPIQALTMSEEFIRIDTVHPHNYLNEHRTCPNDLLYAYGKILYWDTFTDRSQKGTEPRVTQWCLTYDNARKLWFRTANGYSRNA